MKSFVIRQTKMSLVMLFAGIVVAGCVSSPRDTVTVVATRVDGTTIHVAACSYGLRRIAIPQFTHAPSRDSVHVRHGDTLYLRFRNSRVIDDGLSVRGGRPSRPYEEGDSCVLYRLVKDSCVSMALIEGVDARVRFVSMRLPGVAERVTLTVGSSNVFERDAGPRIDEFIGGFP